MLLRLDETSGFRKLHETASAFSFYETRNLLMDPITPESFFIFDV